MKHLPEFIAAADAWAQLTPPTDGDLSDADLIAFHQHFAEVRRTADLRLAQMAAITARRSRPELGHDGLAQRTGARTPEQFVQQVTGVSRREAGTLVRVGSLMDAASAAADATPGALPVVPWVRGTQRRCRPLRPLDRCRGCDPGRADRPRRGRRRSPGRRRRSDSRREVDQRGETRHRARQVRDRLDEAGIAGREEALREKRCLNLYPQPDGTIRISGILDPENAAYLTAAIDAATSPRRGGPRFVDPAARERAKAAGR